MTQDERAEFNKIFEPPMFSSSSGVPLKMEEGKPKLSLVPYEMKAILAKVFEHGLIKYERDSWRKFTAEQARACLADSAERHLSLYNSGQDIDPESGLPHLACVGWNALVLYVITEREKTAI